MDQDKIWDYFQNEAGDSFTGSYPRLKNLVKQFKHGDKVLNIGIGGGVFEKLATENGLQVYSLDPSEKSIDKIKSFLGDEKAKVGYSQSIPFESDYFDGIIMSEVLEHLDNEIIIKTLNEVRRVLKKGGKFIGTVPYKENLTEQIVICPKCGERFHRWGHIQSFDENRVYSIFEKYFSNIICKPKMYIAWNSLNYKGKIIALISYPFFILGIKKSGLNLYFEGIK
jgi:SAM-dependent methyltransferase